MNLLRPSEIVERYPGIKKLWTVNDIGQLLRLKLVRGEKLPRGCKVNESDVRKIFSLTIAD